MAIQDDAVQTTDKKDALDRVLLVIVVDCTLGNDDKETRKIRLREGDLASQTVTGQHLHNLLVNRIGKLEVNAAIEIYDTKNQRFQELPLEETDIVSRFGKCIRCTTSRLPLETSTPPAIMGRFFSYDPSTGLEIAGTKICVQETPNIPGAGTGLNIWDGAVLLARYLELCPETVRSKRVLELGSGCGLVGIAAGVLGAEQVILTDLPYCLPLTRANVDRYRADVRASGCRRIECATCDWFDPPPMNDFFPNGEFEVDVILIADCVWVQELVRPLLSTLKKLLEGRSHPVQVLISYQRRGKAVHEDFWSGIHSLFDVVYQSDTSRVGLEKPGCLLLLECYTTA